MLQFVMIVCTAVAQTQCILPFDIGHQSLQRNLKYQVSLNRVSRQVPSLSLECIHVLVNVQCTIGLSQSSIDQFSRCGTGGLDYIKNFEKDCRINAARERCGLINITNAENICFRSRTTCSSECSNSLTASVMQNGCCNSNFIGLQRYFSLCGVDVPSPCQPSLNIPSSPPINSSCSTENMRMELLCSSGFAPMLDALNSNNCQALAREIEVTCSMQDGEFCIDLMENNMSDLLNAVKYCPSTSSCPQMCQAAINTTNNNRGCCFNIYNTTFVAGTAFSFYAQPFANISGNSLWEVCGVTPPGSCPTSAISAARNTVFSVLAVISLVICNAYLVLFN